MLKEKELYIIQPISLTINDENTNEEIILEQDEVIEVLKRKGITVVIKRMKTNEVFEVSERGLELSI